MDGHSGLSCCQAILGSLGELEKLTKKPTSLIQCSDTSSFLPPSYAHPNSPQDIPQ